MYCRRCKQLKGKMTVLFPLRDCQSASPSSGCWTTSPETVSSQPSDFICIYGDFPFVNIFVLINLQIYLKVTPFNCFSHFQMLHLAIFCNQIWQHWKITRTKLMSFFCSYFMDRCVYVMQWHMCVEVFTETNAENLTIDSQLCSFSKENKRNSCWSHKQN